jgi:hypothetical protein
VDAYTRGFTCCIQAVNDLVLAVLHIEDLAVEIRWYAAHAVMHSRQHWNWLLGHIDARENTCCLGDTW